MSIDLFDGVPSTTQLSEAPGYEEVAKSMFSLPDNWQVFKWECLGVYPNYFGVNVTGAVVTETFKSGQRKGTPNWKMRDRNTEMTVTVPMTVYDQKRRQWEIDTGRCMKCSGTGEELAGISAEGKRMRLCSRCKASGKAPAEIAA